MKERPIIFTNDHVEAILEGRKTQTRRVVKERGDGFFVGSGGLTFHISSLDADIEKVKPWLIPECPYGNPGDKLWVRERFVTENGWPRPAIYMPRAKSRVTLLVKNVRVERLNSITESDCIAEGVLPNTTLGARGEYRRIWDSINKGETAWGNNPWVWVIEFELTSS